jgi:tetratricopeptide (TPR) repeat protein
MLKKAQLRQFFFMGLVCFFYNVANAQTNKADTAQARMYYEQAKKLMNMGKYIQAEVLFVKIFKMDVLLPDEICYHYGKTLFEVKKYAPSKSFIEKYMRLKGENGEYYLPSLQLELDIEKATNPQAPKHCEQVLRDTCHLCRGSGLAFQACTRCEGHGKIICDMCKGNKVNIESTSFGERYFTCSRCKGMGVVECPICEGTKQEKRKCANCRGRGMAYYRRACK